VADYTKPDYWAMKAQREGYPARSVYKLQEIDGKFGLLKGAAGAGREFRVLDLGAAPGSWSLYLLRRFAAEPLRGRASLTAADIAPLSRQYDRGLFDGGNFRFIQGDITGGSVREAILAGGPFNLILSDAAPATTGRRSVDCLRSLALAETALSYAGAALAPGGSLAVKVFQGSDTAAFLASLRGLFTTARTFKPLSCRRESVETYCVGVGKKAV